MGERTRVPLAAEAVHDGVRTGQLALEAGVSIAEGGDLAAQEGDLTAVAAQAREGRHLC